MTTPDYAAIQARLDAATPGPHRAAEGDLEGGSLLDYVATLLGNRQKDGTSTGRLFLVLGRNSIDPEKGVEVVTAMTGDGPQAAANAELIAHAPTDLRALLATVERLERWKAEASEVMAGLRDLGKALGLPLGAQVTGKLATERARELLVENQRLRDTIQAVEDVLDDSAVEGKHPHHCAIYDAWKVDDCDCVVHDVRAALGVSGE